MKIWLKSRQISRVLFSHKKTNKDLKDKQYKNILLKKTKKPCIQKEDSKNEKKINGECIKVKDHIKPKQLLAVKLHSNTRKPGLENYHRINSKQTVQSQFKQNIYHGTDQIPAAIDMAFQRPSLPVITQPRSRPTRVYSRVSHTPTRPTIKPSKTFSKPTQTSQPTQKFSKPTLAFSKPTQTFSKPSKTLSKPTQTFSKPTKMFSKPTNSYTRPTQTVTKPTQSQLLTKPKLIYTRPGNSTFATTNTLVTAAQVSARYVSFPISNMNGLLLMIFSLHIKCFVFLLLFYYYYFCSSCQAHTKPK